MRQFVDDGRWQPRSGGPITRPLSAAMHWPPRPTHLFAPRKLLITMSDSTADSNRLLFVVGWVAAEPSWDGRVGSQRSRAVWQVKMKKEKRGRRSPCVVSNAWKLRFSSFEAGRKTSAVHVYIGYTIVVSDVNRRRYIWWDLVKRCDQPV